MDHPSQEQWMEYLYEELPQQQHESLESHLRECSQCRHAVAGWRAVMAGLDAWQLPRQRRPLAPVLLRAASRLAAAVALVVAGFVIARAMATTADLGTLRAELEASLTQSLEWAVQRAAEDARLTQAPYEELRDDLEALAVGAADRYAGETQLLLSRLVHALDAAREEDRRTLAAALRRIESNRLTDDARIRGDLAFLAAATHDELYRTRWDMASLVSRAPVPSPVSDTPTNPN